MKCRIGTLTGCFLAIGWWLVAGAGLLRAEDEIHYLDRATRSVATVFANIDQETVAGLRYRLGGRTEAVDVPVLDLVDVVYAVPGSLRLQVTRARTEELKSVAPDATAPERLRAIEQAIKEYELLLVQGERNAPAAALRHWKFKIARLKAHAAGEDPARAKAAEEALTSFLRQADSWQTIAAANLLARVLTGQGNAEKAGEAFRQVAKARDLLPEFRREVVRQEIYWDLLGKDTRTASTALAAQKLETPAGSGESVRLQALELLREAVEGRPEKALSQLDTLEAGAKGPADRSLIWLMRGHCEQLAGRDNRAFWAFLRVDQVHRENTFAWARAVEQLDRLFEARTDWPKATQYRCKLWRDFAG
jgi:hypothetical protein